MNMGCANIAEILINMEDYFEQLNQKMLGLYDSLQDEMVRPEIKRRNKELITHYSREMSRLLNKK